MDAVMIYNYVKYNAIYVKSFSVVDDVMIMKLWIINFLNNWRKLLDVNCVKKNRNIVFSVSIVVLSLVLLVVTYVNLHHIFPRMLSHFSIVTNANNAMWVMKKTQYTAIHAVYVILINIFITMFVKRLVIVLYVFKTWKGRSFLLLI